VWFRVAVDAHPDQHGPAPVHRHTAVPVAVDAPAGRRAHRVHVANSADGVHARAVLVPRTARRVQRRQRVHAGLPQKRHVQAVRRVHRVRGVAVQRAAPVPVRLPLPADIPQTQQDPPADRAFLLAPSQGRVAEQSVAATQRFHAAGTFPASIHIHNT